MHRLPSDRRQAQWPRIVVIRRHFWYCELIATVIFTCRWLQLAGGVYAVKIKFTGGNGSHGGGNASFC
jgi:hypothetical protein